MKKGLIAILLVPFFTKAQDCHLKTQKDPYTKEIRISTGFIPLSATQFSIEATKGEVDFMFSFGTGKCFDDASTAAVFYEGTRSKTNMKNGGTMNCDGLFHFTFRNTNPAPSVLQNFGAKKISSIRFKDNTNKETIVVLTPEQQQMFMNLTSCILSEAGKLLQ